MDILLSSNAPLPYADFVLKNYVGAFLEEGGKVTGFSSTDQTWSMEIEVFGDRAQSELQEFASFLRRMKVPSGTTLRYVLSNRTGTIVI